MSKVTIVVVANTEEAIKKLKDLMGGLDKTGDSAEKNNQKMKQFATGLAGAMASSAVAFGAASLKAASDAAEMGSKFDTVFKDQGPAAKQSLEALADTINRSKFDLMGYAATLQDTFVPLGFARDKAAEMSVSVVALAEDLASFNNLNTADVVNDLQSALVGNTETLRKYGVVAQDAQIKQKGLEMGLWDGKSAMDGQTKAAIILQLALDGTTDAQGDAARTADGFANTTRGAEAALKELQIELGTKMLPAATKFVATMKDGIQVLTSLVTWNDNLADAIQEHGRAVADTDVNYASYVEELNRSAKAAGLSINAEGDLVKILMTASGPREEIIRANVLLSESEYNVARASEATAQAVDATTKNYAAFEVAAYGAARATYEKEQADKAAKTAADELKQAESDLSAIISGALGNETEAYTQKQRDAGSAIAETKAKIEELTAAGGDNQAQIQELNATLAEQQAAYAANAAAHEEATARIVFGFLQQRMAADGLQEGELAALAKIGQAWGIYDEKTASALAAVDSAIAEHGANADAILDALDGKIQGLPDRKDIDINIRTNYTQSGTPSPAAGDVGLGGDAPVNYGNGGNGGTPTSGGFAFGGLATGPTSGHWEMLHGNEFVLNPEQTRALMSGQPIPGLTQNMGGVTININGAGNPQAVAVAVRAELDRMGRRADARIRS